MTRAQVDTIITVGCLVGLVMCLMFAAYEVGFYRGEVAESARIARGLEGVIAWDTGSGKMVECRDGKVRVISKGYGAEP